MPESKSWVTYCLDSNKIYMTRDGGGDIFWLHTIVERLRNIQTDENKFMQVCYSTALNYPEQHFNLK